MSSFKSGSISMRMFAVPDGAPVDWIAKLAKAALPPVDTLGEGAISGWCGHQHVQASKITEDSITLGGYTYGQLVKAERKISSSLFRSECKLEELAALAAAGQERLSARTRSDIRESVTARLQPAAQPSFHAIEFVHQPGTTRLLASALTDAQAEAFAIALSHAVGFTILPQTPEILSAQLKVDSRQFDLACFSGEAEGEPVSERLGHDFLTWFWFIAEARRGIIKLPTMGEFGLLIEGPLSFVMEGGGAHQVDCRSGEPRVSSEAKAALLAGKKLARSKITLARGDEMWTCTLLAADFAFRGLKLPQTEVLDAVSRFQDRMRLVEYFADAFTGIFAQFIAERNDQARWPETLKDMRKWVAGRYSRH